MQQSNTRRTIVNRLRHDVNEHSSDSQIFNRYLWNAFWSASRLLVQREADANKLVDQDVFTSFHIETEQVNMFENTCVPIDCIACRAKLPKPLMSKSGPITSFIGSPDMSVSYTIVTPMEFTIKSRIKGVRERYAYIDGDYIYLSKCIPCLKAVIATEQDVVPDKDGEKIACGILDTPINIPDFLIEGSLAIARENLRLALSKPYDHSANKNETT